MKRLFKKLCIGLISLLLMLAILPYSASAAETGSVFLNLSECQVPIPDTATEVSVYKIAGYSDTGQLGITPDFIDSGVKITDLFSATALQMNEIASALKEYTIEEEPPCDVYPARVGTDSTVPVYSDGVYLILIDSISSARYECNFSPMICQIPSYSDDGTKDYDLEITPKYSLGNSTVTVTATVTSTSTVTSFSNVLASDTVTSSTTVTGTTVSTVSSDTTTSGTSTVSTTTTTASHTTVTTTTTRTEEKLPQTGTMLWVVYILAGIGAIILITLWGMCRKDSSGKTTKITMLIIGCICVGSAASLYAQPIFTERASVPVMSMAVSELRNHRGVVADDQPKADTPQSFDDENITDYDVIGYGYEEVPVDDSYNEDTAIVFEAAPQPTYEIDGSYYIGVLEIPAISLELPIADNCAMSTIRYTPGCYYGSAATSNLVIGAHNYKSHFGYLHRLSSGQEVIFTDVNGVQYIYQIVEVTEVSPYSSETVCTSGHDLAMFTCNSSGARRVVVYCDLVNE